jgi:hypothetical protein
VPPAAKAAWVEGFLGGGGLLLAHDTALLTLLDEWVRGLAADDFTDALPLLRRTFGGFAAPERATIGERVRRLAGSGSDSGGGPGGSADADTEASGLDDARARPAVLAAAAILAARRRTPVGAPR